MADRGVLFSVVACLYITKICLNRNKQEYGSKQSICTNEKACSLSYSSVSSFLWFIYSCHRDQSFICCSIYAVHILGGCVSLYKKQFLGYSSPSRPHCKSMNKPILALEFFLRTPSVHTFGRWSRNGSAWMPEYRSRCGPEHLPWPSTVIDASFWLIDRRPSYSSRHWNYGSDEGSDTSMLSNTFSCLRSSVSITYSIVFREKKKRICRSSSKYLPGLFHHWTKQASNSCFACSSAFHSSTTSSLRSFWLPRKLPSSLINGMNTLNCILLDACSCALHYAICSLFFLLTSVLSFLWLQVFILNREEWSAINSNKLRSQLMQHVLPPFMTTTPHQIFELQ